MSRYVVEESNAVDMHEIKTYGDIIVPINDALVDICH